MSCVVFALAVAAPAQENSEEAEADDRAEFKSMVNPIPTDSKSVRRGRMNYMRYCMECHGPDAKAQIDMIADGTDLTAPDLWISGTTPGEVFRSIRDGAGEAMPPYKDQIRHEDEMWHMVNYIISLWPEEYQPKPDETPDEAPEADGEESGE